MWKKVDLVLRFAYVAFIPLFIGVLAAIMPMTAIMISAALATAVALIGGERWRARVGHIRFVGKPLANLGRLGDFYGEHPPKPLIYYVFYPVLLPYWLIAPVARREFLLYRKLNAIAFALIVGGGALDYWTNYRPSIAFKYFVLATIVIMLFQIILTFALITPIVTTLVTLQRHGHRRALWALCGCVALSGVLGVVVAHHVRTKPIKLILRIKARVDASDAEYVDCLKEHPGATTCGATSGALMALAHGLDAAYDVLKRLPEPLTAEARERALDAAQRDLSVYFKPDEADAFEMYAEDGVVMLYVDLGKRERVIWLGRTRNALIFPNQASLLPPAAQKILLHQKN